MGCWKREGPCGCFARVQAVRKEAFFCLIHLAVGKRLRTPPTCCCALRKACLEVSQADRHSKKRVPAPKSLGTAALVRMCSSRASRLHTCPERVPTLRSVGSTKEGGPEWEVIDSRLLTPGGVSWLPARLAAGQISHLPFFQNVLPLLRTYRTVHTGPASVELLTAQSEHGPRPCSLLSYE